MAEHGLRAELRAALNRRQLDPSQRAALALKLLPYKRLREQARQRQQAALEPSEPVRARLPAPADLQGSGDVVATLPAPVAAGRTRDIVAELAGSSPRTVQDVITVHEHDPALFEQVARGEISANAAARRTRRLLRDVGLPAAPPLPTGSFDLIYADPPWRFRGSPDSSRAVENHYPTLPLDEILALSPPAADNALLFLWAVNSLLPEAPHPTLHDLRHSHASMLIHLGCSLADVQHRLGHRKPDTTLRIYTHQWGYRNAQASTIGDQLGTLFNQTPDASENLNHANAQQARR